MRIFFGLTFSEEDKIALARLSGSIDPFIAKGKAVLEKNYHLTLSFLGEVEQKHLDRLCRLIDEVPSPAMELHARNLGLFAARRHNTLFLQVEPNTLLTNLQEQVEQKLIDDRYIAKGGTYRPHITLFRQTLIPILPMIEPVTINPVSLALFHSHQEDGRLCYSIVHEQELGCNG